MHSAEHWRVLDWWGMRMRKEDASMQSSMGA